jgi:hypothetical protein
LECPFSDDRHVDVAIATVDELFRAADAVESGGTPSTPVCCIIRKDSLGSAAARGRN